MSLSKKETKTLVEKATIFGYPIVLMEITRRVATAVPKLTPEKGKVPANQLLNLVTLPDHTFRDVVRPNVDTLYSIIFLDLLKEPMVLSLPEMGERYYLMEFLDAWTNVFASPGTRTTGSKAGNFAIAGPSWQGKMPEGIKLIKAPTNMAWMIGRTQVDGSDDLPKVKAIVGQYELVPLSAWGKEYVPSDVTFDPGIDERAPLIQVESMDANTFFQSLADLMVDNPPAKEDAPILDELSAMGLKPGKFEPNSDITDALKDGKVAGLAKIKASLVTIGESTNGWNIMLEHIGTYGTNYLTRAAVALTGLGANLPEDAIYPVNLGVDSEGAPLSPEHEYVMHFESGSTPPANAFWSITMYDKDGYLVDNPIRRYAIGDRDDLEFNNDGSLDIYIQRKSPGSDKDSNWLPAPAKGIFTPTMRVYWPKEEMLTGKWKPPGIRRIK